MEIQRCCIKYCNTETDNLCKDYEKQSEKADCPTIKDAIPESPPAPVDIMKLSYDPEIVTDLKVIEGKSTTCPPEHTKAKCFDKNRKFQNDCDINKGAGGKTCTYV